MFQHHNGGGARNKWLFKYTAGQLAQGARLQKEYREKRLKIWKTKREEVMAEIRSKGLSVTDSAMDSLLESMAGSYQMSNAKAYRPNNGPTIQVDERLKEKLAECYAKVNEHETLATEYEVWIQTLQAQPDVQLEIDQTDFKFFFLNVDMSGILNTPASPVPSPRPSSRTKSEPSVAVTPAVKLEPPSTPVLKPSGGTPLLQPSSGQISPIPAFVQPPVGAPVGAPAPAPTLSAPVTPTTVFVPPDFEDEFIDVPRAIDALDNDWPQD